MNEPLTLSRWLAWAYSHPQAIVAIRRDGMVTAQTLLADLNATREAIERASEGRTQEEITLYSPESLYDFLVAFLGILVAGHIPVLQGAQRPTKEGMWIGNASGLSRVDSVSDGALSARHIAFTRTQPEQPEASHAVGPCQLPPEAKLILFTSGSTGCPKAVEKTISQMDAEMRSVSAHWQTHSPRTLTHGYCVSTADPHHLYGLSFVIFLTLSQRLILWDERIRFEDQLEEIAQTCLSQWVWVTTPTFIRHLSEPLKAPPRFGVSAGGALTDVALQRWGDYVGVDLEEIYGSTETGVVGHRCHRFIEKLQGGDCPPVDWQLTPDAHWVSDSADEAAEGALRFQSAHLAPDEVGGVALADQIERVSDRTFRLLGRADRIVKVGEERISLSQIERSIAQTLGFVVECFLIRTPLRETIGVVVARDLSPSYDPHAHEKYRQRLRHVLPWVAVPRHWRSVASWPINERGKIDRSVLVKSFENKEER